MEDQDLPYYVKIASNPVFSDEKLNLSIFELSEFGNAKQLYSSKNDFESPKSNWSEVPVQNSKVYSGSYSEKIDEYSTTFEIALDSILSDSIDKLLISAKLQVFADEDSECQLVISIESKGNQYYWKGFNLKKYTKSMGSWWLANNNIIIDKSAIQEDSILKIYIWNNKKNEIFIDDFNADIFSLKN